MSESKLKPEEIFPEEKVEVVVIFHEPGMTQRCKKCRRVLCEGQFAVGVWVGEGVTAKKYLIGVDPPIQCCGEEKKLIRTFTLRKHAVSVCSEVTTSLNTKRTTEELPLMEVSFGGQN